MSAKKYIVKIRLFWTPIAPIKGGTIQTKPQEQLLVLLRFIPYISLINITDKEEKNVRKRDI